MPIHDAETILPATPTTRALGYERYSKENKL